MQANIRQHALSNVVGRLITFMVGMYLLNFLDRVNIGFAALQMNKDLGFTPEMYGFDAGILFAGYVAFEVPSNLIMSITGAVTVIALGRRGIGRREAALTGRNSAGK